jgi:CRP-like cAMP-binding protein
MPAVAPRDSELVWRHGFLAELNDAAREAILQLGRARRYGSGAVLFREGDPSTFAVAVMSGRLKVSCTSPEGHETVLAFRRPGDLVGELSLFDGADRSATVTAVEPAQVLVITADRLTDLIRDQPDVAVVLLRLLARRLRDADRKRVEFGAYDTAGRVARRLVELAEEHGVTDGRGAVRISLPLSQTELASWAGSSREAVARALALLRGGGLIETDRRSIVVLDIIGLRAIVS